MDALTAERWRLLSPWLDQALDLPVNDRAAWLEARRRDDPDLARDLEALLSTHVGASDDGFLDDDVVDRVSGGRATLAGTVLGAWRLVSLLGEGGSGSVWLAERCDGRFEGRAAVKLLNLALVGRSGEARFRREGTILARLRHPRIAHLIDAGVSDMGQPYLVLELVDGVPIDLYCAQHALTIDARLSLCLDVLDAVAFAHAHLVVHRDIKPANVLVSHDGHVTLLDFGIAKLVESAREDAPDRSEAALALTREIGRALTPEYAAPEQLAGQPVTTATDVYALGVLLHVLLTGRHPAGSAVVTPATLLRAIIETVPPLMSEVAGSPQDRRALQGDLDTIVATALHKSPEARYSTVTALADDVRRAMRHEPITARRATWTYRTTRFLQRHRHAALATVGALGLLVTTIAVYTWRLAEERDRAQREAVKAMQISDVLMGLLTSADPYAPTTGHGAPTTIALLDGHADRIRSELVGHPEVQAGLLTALGRTYRRLGSLDRAQTMLEQALASGIAAFGATDARVAETRNDLGVTLADRGAPIEAIAMLQEALAIRRQRLGPRDPEVAVTLAELGRVHQDRGDNALAEPLHREALDIRRDVLGPGHRETAVSESDLASVLRLKGELGRAEALLRSALATNRRTRGPRHPNTAMTLHDLALVASARGAHAEADASLRAALEMQLEVLGPDHAVVAVTRRTLARTLGAAGRIDDAARELDAALTTARAALGDAHQGVAILRVERARTFLRQGRPGEALPLLDAALSVRLRNPDLVPSRRRTFADDDWSPATIRRLQAEARSAFARPQTTVLSRRTPTVTR